MHDCIRITALTEVYGSGQKYTGACIEYASEIDETALCADAFLVDGQTVTGAHPVKAAGGEIARRSRHVLLTLSTKPAQNTTLARSGQGRGSRLIVNAPQLTVAQTRAIQSVDGTLLPPFEGVRTTAVDNGIADRFSLLRFQTPDGRRLDYQLFAPRHFAPGHRYPLVLFMHDAGSCSDDPMAPIVQGSGAVVWARDALSGRRPCFVVAPHYPQVCASDDFTVTWQADATMGLLRQLLQACPIDGARVYGTGQSMGCMMLCEMMLQNPGFFAASLLVAGQWSPERMVALRDEHLWGVVSSGDEKAFPILGAAMRNMRAAGGRLSLSALDARADASDLNAQIRSVKSRGCNLNFSWFQGASVLPEGAMDHPGMHHMCSWHRAYDIEALREWLFEQRAVGVGGNP